MFYLNSNLLSYKGIKFSKSGYIKLGLLRSVLIKLNNNKFYSIIKNKTFYINNKLFANIYNEVSKYHTHDIYTAQYSLVIAKKILSRLLSGYNNYCYKRRYYYKDNCLLYLYYFIGTALFVRLYSITSYQTFVILITYLFNINYDNDELNNYIKKLGTEDYNLLLESIIINNK